MATKKVRGISGRAAERAALGRALDSDRSEFIAIYGRRRVGKTYLVRRFFEGVPGGYFEMVGRFGGSTDDHLRIFAEALGQGFYRGASMAVPGSWHEAFRALQDSIDNREARGKCVLFFDELPWIATHRSGFLQELEHFWNAWCSRRDDLVLIVCGSAASWMLRKIVNARGGLHNRLTRTLRLLPFTLPEVKGFFADRMIPFTDRQLVELYMLFGGVPHYLEHVERGQSVPQIVDAAYLDAHGPLAGEFDRLLASLFEADRRYVDVVRALARKRRGLTRSELLQSAGLRTGGGATAILDNLQRGGFIDVTVPFGRNSRDRIHRLTDELMLFHLSWLERSRPKSWQGVRGTPRWRAWAGLAFESVCLKHVDAIEKALGIYGVRSSASAWLHEDAQIDLLIDRADDVVSICEIKFTDAPFPITKRYAAELRRKVDAFVRHTGTRKATHLVFVTSYGVQPGAHARELVDAEVTMDALLT